ncbi:MAG: hypothetical protein ACQEWV_02420 [Bacillota bacterium]
MEHTSAVRNLFQQTVSQMSQPQKLLTLKENQVVMGHVLKLFPDQKALIQVGHSKLVAHLETSINALEKYWFTVKGSEHQSITLKIVKQVKEDKSSQLTVAKDLLGLFQQRPTKENVLLANELMKENIPITKDQLVAATEILKNTSKSDSSRSIQAIISAIKKSYPISEVVVRSIREAQTIIPLAKQIDQLFDTLQQEKQQSPAMKLLKDSLFQLIQNPTEHNIGENLKEMLSLKDLLIATSKEAHRPMLREQIDQLVNRLNGQSLLYQDNGPTQQIITQIPLFLNNHESDLTIQWNGKKQEDGTIDPAFCRILFYLHLPTLNETMIDVQIQNRVMNITIRNNSEALVELITLKSGGLKELLKKMNYHITSVNVKPFETNNATRGKFIKQTHVPHATSYYTGVDIKI